MSAPLGEPGRWHHEDVFPSDEAVVAAADAPLGFLCLVPCDRDRPQLPDDADVAAIRGPLDR